MHIPDGYLSPSTCAIAFAAATPFWFVATRRLKRAMHTRLVPVLSAMAAFSFVVMMFNIPLPGGTTGHAAGMGIAAILLGPWAATLAISVALFIQAVFFGDGGILAFGANALMIGVVGSFVSFGVYRMLAGPIEVTSRRQIWAAAIAGYVGINAAALATAIAFGIQPMLFTDASGAPLYAPYPLSVAVPAMMLGHLTIAGFAEAAITGGLVAFLQRNNPELLIQPGAPETGGHNTSGWNSMRGLCAIIATLMVASPLGLLAAGTAWGEWAATDFADATTRQQIASASGQALPVEGAPRGLARFSEIWTAPWPDYAPSFMQHEGFGYMLSAMMGCGLVILMVLGLAALVKRRTRFKSAA